MPEPPEPLDNERKRVDESNSVFKPEAWSFSVAEGRISQGLTQFLRQYHFLTDIHSFDKLNNAGWTPLTYAIHLGHEPAIHELTAFYADLNKTNLAGLRPLELAEERLRKDPSFERTFWTLVDRGARQRSGFTAPPGSIWGQVERRLAELERQTPHTRLHQRYVDAIEPFASVKIPEPRASTYSKKLSIDETKRFNEDYFLNLEEKKKIQEIRLKNQKNMIPVPTDIGELNIFLKSLTTERLSQSKEDQEHLIQLCNKLIPNLKLNTDEDQMLFASIAGLLGILSEEHQKKLLDAIQSSSLIPSNVNIYQYLINYFIKQNDFFTLHLLLKNDVFLKQFRSLDFNQFKEELIEKQCALIALWIETRDNFAAFGEQTELQKVTKALNLEFDDRLFKTGPEIYAPDIIDFFTRKENYDPFLLKQLITTSHIRLAEVEADAIQLLEKIFESHAERNPEALIYCLNHFKKNIVLTPTLIQTALFEIYPRLRNDPQNETLRYSLLELLQDHLENQNSDNAPFINILLKEEDRVFVDFLKHYQGVKATEYRFMAFCHLANSKQDFNIEELYHSIVTKEPHYFSKLLQEQSPLLKSLTEMLENAIKNEQLHLIRFSLEKFLKPEFSSSIILSLMNVAKKYNKHEAYQIFLDALKEPKKEDIKLAAEFLQASPIKKSSILKDAKTSHEETKLIGEISELSIEPLSRAIPMPPAFNYELELDLFAQLQNDYQISGSQYEGNTIQRTSQYQESMANFIKANASHDYFKPYESLLPELDIIQNELKHFQEALKIIDDCLHQGTVATINKDALYQRILRQYSGYDNRTITEAFHEALKREQYEQKVNIRKQAVASIIELLKKNPNIILPTGWLGSKDPESNQETTGHAMLIKIEKVGEQYRVILFNTGSGLESHKSKLDKTKTKYCPVRVLENVSSSQLPFLVENLVLAPQVNPAWWSGPPSSFVDKNSFNSKDIYQTWEQLKEFEVDPLSYFPHYMTPQRGGTCASKIFSPYQRSVLRNKFKLYKHLSKELINIHALIQMNQGKIIPNPASISELEYSLENFARFLGKLKKSNFPAHILAMSEERLMGFNEQLKKIKENDALQQEKLASELVVQELKTNLDESATTYLRNPITNLDNEIKIGAEIDSLPLQQFEIKELNEVSLAQFVTLCEKYQQNNQFQEIKTIIENLVCQLDIPLNKIPDLNKNPGKAKQGIQLLDKVYTLYNQANLVLTQGKESSESQMVNAILRIHSLGILEQYQENLSEGLYIIREMKNELTSMKDNFNSIYFNNYHPKWWPLQQKLKSEIDKIIKKTESFGYPQHDYIKKHYPALERVGQLLALEEARQYSIKFPNTPYTLGTGPAEIINEILKLCGNEFYLISNKEINTPANSDLIKLATEQLRLFTIDQNVATSYSPLFKNMNQNFRNTLNKRYAEVHSPVVHYILTEKNYYENTNDIQKISFPYRLSNEERALIKRLLHVRSSRTNRIFSTMDFFKNFPNLMNQYNKKGMDLGKDYQLLFHFHLFEPGFLQHELKINQELHQQILQFILGGIQTYRDDQCLLPAGAFLYEQAVLLSDYFPTEVALTQLNEDLDFFKKNEAAILRIENKRLAYGRLCKIKAYSLLDNFEKNPDSLTIDNIQNFLKLYIKSHTLENETPVLIEVTQIFESKLTEKFAKVRVLLQQKLKDPLLLRAIIMDVIQEQSPEYLNKFKKEESEIFNQFPILIIKNKLTQESIKINIETGVLFSQGSLKKGKLPRDILESSYFIDTFGNIDPDALVSLNEGIFEFQKDNISYRLLYPVILGAEWSRSYPEVQIKTMVDGQEIWGKKIEKRSATGGGSFLFGTGDFPVTVQQNYNCYGNANEAFWLSKKDGQLKLKSLSDSVVHLITLDEMPIYEGKGHPLTLIQKHLPSVHPLLIKCKDEFYIFCDSMRRRFQKGPIADKIPAEYIPYCRDLPFPDKPKNILQIPFEKISVNLKDYVIRETDYKIKDKIFRIDEKGNLTPFQLRSRFAKLSPIMGFFKQFEDETHIEIYDNKNTEGPPLQVRLPRYNLEFISEKHQDKWQLFIKNNHAKPHLRVVMDEPKPVLIKNFHAWFQIEDIFSPDITLQKENVKTRKIKERFALIPKQAFIAPRSESQQKGLPNFNLRGKEVNINRDFYKSDSYHNKQNYIGDFPELSLLEGTEEFVKIKIEKGRLHPEKGEDLLYVAYLNFYNHDPKEAYRLLTEGQKNAPLLGSSQEKNWLEAMVLHHQDKQSSSFFKSAGFLSVTLQAASLLINNHLLKDPALLTTTSENKEFSKAIIAALTAYLDTLQNTPIDMRLSPMTELAILNFLEKDPQVDFKALPKPLLARHQMLKGFTLLKERQALLTTAKTAFAEERLKEIHERFQKGAVKIPISVEIGETIDASLIPELKSIDEHIHFNLFNMLNSKEAIVANFKNLSRMAALKEPIESYCSKDIAETLIFQKQHMMNTIYREFEKLRLKIVNQAFDPANTLTPFEKLCFEYLKILILINDDPDKYQAFLQAIENSNTLEIISTLNTYNAILSHEVSLTLHVPITSELIESEWSVKEFEALLTTPAILQKDLSENLQSQFQLPLKTIIESKKEAENDFYKKLPEYLQQDYAMGRQRNIETHQFRHFCVTTLKQFIKENGELFQTQLESSLKKLDDEVLALRTELEKIANSQFESRSKLLALLGKENKLLRIDDLIALFMSQNPNQYSIETGLSLEDIKSLHEKIGIFLAKNLKHQQLNRTETQLNLLKTKDPNTLVYGRILQNLGTELYSHRDNLEPYIKQPALLAFEYYENKMLRANQISVVGSLLKQENGVFKNKLVQLIMGGGKSKVLTPLTLKQKALGNNLCIVHVPASLFEMSLIDLQQTSRRLFNQEAIPFQFERNKPYTSSFLESLYKQLESCMLQKNYIVTTGASVRSLKLKSYDIYEALKHQPSNQELWKQLFAIEKIQTLFKKKGDAFIDEIDLSANIEQELNYPLDVEQSLDPVSNKSFSDLYTSLLEFESVKTVQELLKYYSEKSQESIKERLKHLPEFLINQRPDLNPSIYNIIKNMAPPEKQNIISYLHNHPETNMTAILALPKAARNILALYKHQINSLLPLTLSKRPNEHYGFSKILPYPEKEIPIPYSASQTPKEGSQFSNLYTASNYAMQLQYFTGISIDSFKLLIGHFKDKATIEFGNQKTKNMLSLSDTPSGREFHRITGIHIPLNDINLNDAALVSNIFTENVSKKLEVINFVNEHYILPQIKMNTKMLTMNAVQEMSQYRSVQGVSGTLWNWRSFHEKLALDVTESLGIDGQTIDTLLNKEINIIPQTSKNIHETLKAYFKQQAEPHKVHAIIDIGALFKDYTNEAVVDAVIQQLKQQPNNLCQYVLYFNSENLLCARSMNDGSTKVIGTSDYEVIKRTLKCDESAWFTFYDQAHTTGVDIKQALDARACVTFNDNLFRDFSQGAYRLRDIDAEQNIDVLIPNELFQALGSSSSIQSILARSIQNQDTLAKQHNYISAIKKLHRIFQDNLDELLENITHPKRKLQFYNLCQQFFTQTHELDPFAELGDIEKNDLNPTLLLKKYQQYYLNNWRNIINSATQSHPPLCPLQDSDALHKKLEAESLNIIETIKDHLPDTITAKTHENINTTQEATRHQTSSRQVTALVDEKQMKESMNEAQAQKQQYSIPPGKYIWSSPVYRRPWEEAEFHSWRKTFHDEVASNAGVADSVVGGKEDEALRLKESQDNPKSATTTESYAKPGLLQDVVETGKSLHLSPHLLVSYDYQHTFFNVKMVEGETKKPVQYVLMKMFQNKMEAVIITALEAAELQNFIQLNQSTLDKEKESPTVWIQTVNGTVFAGKRPQNLPTEYQTINEQLHYYSGDLEYLYDNLDKNQWFTREQLRPLLKNYQEKILQDEPLNNSSFPFLQEKLLKEAPTLEEAKPQPSLQFKEGKAQKLRLSQELRLKKKPKQRPEGS